MEQLKAFDRINSILTDEEVVDMVLQGKKEMYEVIIRKYNQRLFRISRSYVKDEDEAEDVVQETYIKAYEHLKDYKGSAKFSTWLTRILINESLSRLKYKSRLSFVSLQAVVPGEKTIDEVNQPDMQTPDKKIINSELKEILESAIDELPQKYRSAFVMREIEDMNTAETGECLSISPSNVKVRLNRAKEMLRAKLRDLYRDANVYEFHLLRCNRIVAGVLDSVESYTETVHR